MQIKIIKKEESDFPERLKLLPDCPKEIYIAGKILPQDTLALAVVGTRKMTSYGREVCYDIVSQVAKCGITIVSGLMYGIDITAHRAALEAGGRTIGVLGFGFNYLNKVVDRGLVGDIVNGKGAVISEFNNVEKPAPWTFPKRNRIISALANAVLVIEADIDSGSFYTVKACLKQKKKVLAVPGSIYSNVSKGTNLLIKEGSELVTSAQDVLKHFNLKEVGLIKNTKLSFSLTEFEKAIFKILNEGDNEIDNIIRRSKRNPGEVLSTLALLEMKGAVKEGEKGKYRKI